VALEARAGRRRETQERFNAWRRARGYAELRALGRFADHLTPIVLLAMNTGCRRHEPLGLAWRDVDLGAARLTVRAAFAKSGLSRVIQLNAEAVRVLRAWQPEGHSPDALVFPASEDVPMKKLRTSFISLRRAAKIREFRFHEWPSLREPAGPAWRRPQPRACAARAR